MQYILGQFYNEDVKYLFLEGTLSQLTATK